VVGAAETGTTADETIRLDRGRIMRLKTGQYVRHSRYGWGTILEGDGKRTMVYFRNVGIKKFATSRTAFTIIGGQAHKKTAA
jgi:hypothetical protein